MARFGQGFLQALTQPSYGQGLFNLGSAIGSAPAMAKEREARQNMLQQFMQGSPIQQGRVLQQEGMRKGDLAMIAQGQQIEQNQLKKGATQGIQALITQVSDPETSEEIVKSSRETAIRLARENGVPEDTVRQQLDAAETQRFTNKLGADVNKVRALTIEAKRMLANGQSLEDFEAKHGSDYSFVYTEIKNQQEIADAQLKNARDNAAMNEYKYTDQQLKDLGLNEQQIKTINSLPTGKNKNAAVYKFLVDSVNKQPNAALLTLYAEALLPTIMEEYNLDYGDTDELVKGRALAKERVVQHYSEDPSQVGAGVIGAKNDSESNGIDVNAAIAEIAKALGVE